MKPEKRELSEEERAQRKAEKRARREAEASKAAAVSYTHLTLPTICSV